MKKLTVTPDTNVVVSGIILKRGIPFSILSLWKQHEFTIVLSPALIDEAAETLSRLKIVKQYDISAERIRKLVFRLKENSTIIIPANISSAIVIRDKKDAVILGTALSGQADYLVTGDKDLLVLDGNPHIGKLRILTPRQFLDSLKHT